jgi:alpha-1,3-mannosyl-glycoprotein beta-1,2-N-acetylglucosaminyltransferase
LKYIKLNEKFVPFSKKDLTYLLKDNYDKTFIANVYKTPVVTIDELRKGIVKVDGPVRIQYNNRNQYKITAKGLGIMDEFKVTIQTNIIDYLKIYQLLFSQSGVPRTAYAGIVSTFYANRRVYLAPSANWKGYDPSW